MWNPCWLVHRFLLVVRCLTVFVCFCFLVLFCVQQKMFLGAPYPCLSSLRIHFASHARGSVLQFFLFVFVVAAIFFIFCLFFSSFLYFFFAYKVQGTSTWNWWRIVFAVEIWVRIVGPNPSVVRGVGSVLSRSRLRSDASKLLTLRASSSSIQGTTATPPQQ